VGNEPLPTWQALDDLVRMQEVTGPPDFDPKTAKLDFSIWHPLDHWPGSPYCQSLYGGWRRHLQLAWDYRWSDRLLKPWHKVTCKFDHHHIIKIGTRAEGEEWREWYMCGYCGKPFDDETGENFATF
jgi:hypothetical protein